MTFKIYTKTGDKGETSLIGGVRVPKYHLRIESYGTIDELNSYIGLIIDALQNKEAAKTLYEIQDRLFTIGALLATTPEKTKMKVPDVHETDITLLENEMDAMDVQLPELKSFILPGGTIVASYCHVARCVCRRAERLASALNELEAFQPETLMYLNRLSDYLFVLARKLSYDLQAEEIKWVPKKES